MKTTRESREDKVPDEKCTLTYKSCVSGNARQASPIVSSGRVLIACSRYQAHQAAAR